MMLDTIAENSFIHVIVEFFSQIDDSANVGNKGLCRKEQNKFSKKVTSSGNLTWAYFASVNFTFVGAQIDFWT